jgi:hypothetical protein
VRRIAFGGLVLIGVAVAAGLVLWLAIFSVHENHASGAVTATARLSAAVVVTPAPRHAPTAQATEGSTCFVSVPECSEQPCVEFVQSANTTAVYVPTPARPVARSRSHCPPAVPHIATTAIARGAKTGANPYGRALPSLRAKLSRRFP